MSELTRILARHSAFEPIVQNGKPYRKLDFTAANTDLLSRDLSETDDFSNYVFDEMLSSGSFNGIGGYGEDRVIYRNRKHFSSNADKPRSIHLGVDIWAAAGTPLHAPLDGIVHSFAFNNQYGDYGPTIILAHDLSGSTFFTLYGHLSLSSLEGMHKGKRIEADKPFAAIGTYPENGDWPSHLHFQIIREMGGYEGDFPGVCNAADRNYYLNLCPDPGLILRVNL